MDHKRPRDESDSDSSAVELEDLAAIVNGQIDNNSARDEVRKETESDHEEDDEVSATSSVSGGADNDDDFMSFHASRPMAAEASAARRGIPPWLDTPWNGRTPPLVALHNEILRFCDLVSPTAAERAARATAAADVKRVLKSLFPTGKVAIFGSELTGLCLPSSDIDMTCLGVNLNDPRGKPLHQFASALRHSGLVSQLEVVEHAKVPIVKLVHASTQVAADVSFNVPDGLATGWFMRDQLVKHPALRPLLLVLKFFLAQRNLNETYPSGGVGSFLLQMMALSFVQHRALNRRAAAAADRAKNANNNRRGSGGGGGGGDQNEQASKLSSPFDGGGNDDADCQLGLLLLGFLELYGRKLNLDEVGISVLGQGSYFRKQHKQWEGGPPRASGLLCMENPLLPKVDVGKNAFNFATVRRAMIHGHMVLTEAIVVQHEAMKATPIDSLTSSGSSSSSSSAAASSSAPSSPKAVSALAAIIFAADPLLTERELPPRPAPPLVHQIDSTTAAEEKHQQSSDQHALSSRGMNALFSATLPPPPQPRYDDEDEEKSSDSLDDDDSATQKKSKPSGRSSSAPPLSKRSKSEASAKKNQQIQQLAEDFGDYASAAKKFKSEKKAAKNKKALAAKKDKKKAISKVDLETVDPEAHQAKMASKAAKRARKKARKNDTAGDSTTTSPAFTITNRSDTRAPDGVVLATK